MNSRFQIVLQPSEIIHVLLARQGLSLAAVAKQLGLTRKAISGVVNGHWRSQRVESYLSELLGFSLTELFGQASEDIASQSNCEVKYPEGNEEIGEELE